MTQHRDPLVAGPGQRVESYRDMCADVPEWLTRKGYVLIESEKVDPSGRFHNYLFERLIDLNPPAEPEPAADPALPKDTQEPAKDNGRVSRRIGAGPEKQPAITYRSLSRMIPNPEPDWFIAVRRAWFDEKNDLLSRLHTLEEKNKMSATDNLALATYGEKQDLAVVKERVSLTTYGATLSDKGRDMVAQLCWLMDWNPFFDVHAFASGGRIIVMPDYKKLLEIVRENERINYETRPMTAEERIANGLSDTQVGAICEITEIDTFLEYVKAGVGDQYKRIKGIGIWSTGDNIPKTWTKEMVAGKRALRHGLYHLTQYKIASKRLQQALMQAGAIGVEETEDGYGFDAPPAVEQPPIVIIDQPAAAVVDMTTGEVTAPVAPDDLDFQSRMVEAEKTEGFIARTAKAHQEPDSAPSPSEMETAEPPASALDEFLGPRETNGNGAEYDPRTDTDAFASKTNEKLQAWLFFHYPPVRDADPKQREFKKSGCILAGAKEAGFIAKDESWPALYRAQKTVSEIFAAVEAHYAAETETAAPA